MNNKFEIYKLGFRLEKKVFIINKTDFLHLSLYSYYFRIT